MAHAPFRRGRFDDLPDLPRIPHPYFETTAREIEVRSAPLGRVKIHLREHGKGEPLFLVHGLMTSSYSWRYVLDSLGDRFRLIIPDLPGSGRSDMPRGPYTGPALATFLGELMTSLDLRGCRAIGNSLGGHLCMRLALRDPGAFSRLVVIHSPGIPEARLHALTKLLRIPGMQSLVASLARRDPERWAHRNVHYWDESLKSLEEAREYGAPLRSVEGSRAFARILAEVLDPRDLGHFVRELETRRDAAQTFPVPLLFVYARQDPMVSPRIGEALSSLVPSAEMKWMEETSHFAHVDTPDRLVAEVMPFLRA